jgi:hypothetical protein
MPNQVVSRRDIRINPDRSLCFDCYDDDRQPATRCSHVKTFTLRQSLDPCSCGERVRVIWAQLAPQVGQYAAELLLRPGVISTSRHLLSNAESGE